MINYDIDNAGIPYNDISWYDVVGQPFGTASNFNVIVFGDANNIVDTKGAMAVGGNFTSGRGLTLGYGNDGKLTGTGYSPDFVRFLTGGNVNMQGNLVIVGHVVSGGNLQVGKGSTYMIGKDGSADQVQELTALYQANGGSKYWRLSDRNTHFAVSSYDTSRYIPANRVGADTARFFSDAFNSISYFHDCITGLQPNGTVTEHYSEWILRGTDPEQNVFLIDVRPNGILNKEIRFDIPVGSLALVILRTGSNAHLNYGLWGNENLANRTLYVFEDARNIYMEVPAAIWGSILAPQAIFHANQSGGTVNGNAALGSLVVSVTSGFEFHLFQFIGGVGCRPVEVPAPEVMPPPPVAPIPVPTPLPAMPAPAPVPVPLPAPVPMPVPPPVPAPMPIPVLPPMPTPVPVPRPLPPPVPVPVPPVPCPPCPECPEQEIRLGIQPIPVPVPCPQQEECRIIPGIIFGCIWGCNCCSNHEWIVRLYKCCQDKKALLYEVIICYCGCFEFEVPYDEFYVLQICPAKHGKGSGCCRPILSLKNVGVANLMIE